MSTRFKMLLVAMFLRRRFPGRADFTGERISADSGDQLNVESR